MKGGVNFLNYAFEHVARLGCHDHYLVKRNFSRAEQWGNLVNWDKMCQCH